MPSVKNMLAAAGGAGGAGPNVEEVFSTYLYTGNNTTNNIVNGIDFSTEGGMLWIKNRNDGGGPHTVYDTNRGNNSGLRTNASDDAETGTNNTQDLTAFNSNGFSLGTGWAENVNYNNQEYCSWSFRKAPKFFDVVTYTGDGTSGRSISHNLGCDVGMIIIKNLSRSSDWHTWHRGFTSTSYGAALNQTYAEFTNGGILTATPTSTTVTIKNPGYDGAGTNNSGDSYVMYLFAHNNGDGEFGSSADQDIIKCGSYTGDGGAGTTEVNLGFEPQWILVKATSAADNWFVLDTMRGWCSHPNVANDAYVFANAANAEATGGVLDITPTGFKTTLYTNVNVNGREYIYMAIRRGLMAEPTSASDVFNVTDSGSSASSVVNTGFAADFNINTQYNGNADKWAIARLLGNGYLTTSTQSAFVADSNVNYFDHGTGSSAVDTTTNWWGSTTNVVNYSWARAPGFFDVVTYQGDGNAGLTINHNLGVVPEMMWIRNRETASGDWTVYHKDIDVDNDSAPETDAVYITQANAAFDFTMWNDTAPTATQFTVGNYFYTNANNTQFLALMFGTVSGVSKVGGYTGTGSSFNVDCGFSNGASFVLIKRWDASADWYLWDSARGINSATEPYLRLNSTSAESGGTDWIDPHSSGFTVTNGAGTSINTNGGKYIFYAIAA